MKVKLMEACSPISSKTHFQETFSRCRFPKGKRFLQDGCPVQNSKKARQALDTVGAIKFSITPREKYF